MSAFVDTSKIFLREINPKVAKDMIVTNHYSHAWTMCSVAIGIFIEIDGDSDFFNDTEKLVGCLIYGNPVGRSAAASICESVEINEVYELTRLWISDELGKNAESYCISQSFRWLKENHPHVKMLISYSDPDQKHLGGIYQATNWIYQGQGEGIQLMPNYSVSLRNDPYKWIHSRTVFSKFGSHNVEKLKLSIGQTFWRRQEPSKHRYIYFLTGKAITRKLKKKLKHPPLPYPKSSKDYNETIQEIKGEFKSDFFE
jgi:hypothetical protein